MSMVTSMVTALFDFTTPEALKKSLDKQILFIKIDIIIH